jgi:hypothetical protein
VLPILALNDQRQAELAGIVQNRQERVPVGLALSLVAVALLVFNGWMVGHWLRSIRVGVRDEGTTSAPTRTPF